MTGRRSDAFTAAPNSAMTIGHLTIALGIAAVGTTAYALSLKGPNAGWHFLRWIEPLIGLWALFGLAFVAWLLDRLRKR